ncbi:MAG: hypothetical protein AB7Q29_14205 [Vicinamibacterales bacterium]
MQLRHARLCLDCEEVHGSTRCPACTSESFAYLARWIPPGVTRGEADDTQPEGPPEPNARARADGGSPDGKALRSAGSLRWVKRGVAGVAVLAVTRLLWNAGRPVGWSSEPSSSDAQDRSSDESF